jgi:hypothetical protein
MMAIYGIMMRAGEQGEGRNTAGCRGGRHGAGGGEWDNGVALLGGEWGDICNIEQTTTIGQT